MAEKKIRFPVAVVPLAVYCIMFILRFEPIGGAIQKALNYGLFANIFERFLVNWVISYKYNAINIWNILIIVLSIFICVVLTLRKRDNILVASVALLAVVKWMSFLYMLYQHFAHQPIFVGSIGVGMINVIAYTFTLVLVFCSCDRTIFNLSGKKVALFVKKLWFIPAVLFVFEAIVSFLNVDFLPPPDIADFCQFTLLSFVYALSMLIFGHWLVYPNKKTTPDVVIDNEVEDAYSTSRDGLDVLDNRPSSTISAQPVADELIKYKELLDIGAITQEEFDAKKKQLLEM